MKNTYVAIMAGGIGSRFWPGSRVSRPKQFLDILGVGKSLIRMTYERFLNVCPSEHIYIVTNSMYKSLVKEHLPELDESQILCEPSRNNTAPCVAYTAMKLHATNPDANFVVAPSDHIILNETAFTQKINKALSYAQNNKALLTLGIQPSRPDTGYGYINYQTTGEDGVHKVVKFTEKPQIEKAKQFLASGDYLWNAGIFVWNVNSILDAFKELVPDLYNTLAPLIPALNTPNEQAELDRIYPNSPNISVDYAILEKADNVYTIPSEFGWSDLGTWASLHAEYDKDEHNNAIYSDDVLTYNTTNSLIHTPKGKLVVLKDIDDYIIVDDKDVLLICPKSKEQEIKAITTELKAMKKDRFL